MRKKALNKKLYKLDLSSDSDLCNVIKQNEEQISFFENKCLELEKNYNYHVNNINSVLRYIYECGLSNEREYKILSFLAVKENKLFLKVVFSYLDRLTTIIKDYPLDFKTMMMQKIDSLKESIYEIEKVRSLYSKNFIDKCAFDVKQDKILKIQKRIKRGIYENKI